jgi:hypothetical protein
MTSSLSSPLPICSAAVAKLHYADRRPVVVLYTPTDRGSVLSRALDNLTDAWYLGVDHSDAPLTAEIRVLRCTIGNYGLVVDTPRNVSPQVWAILRKAVESEGVRLVILAEGVCRYSMPDWLPDWLAAHDGVAVTVEALTA